MEDWSFVESQFDQLNADLNYAKEHPFKVKFEFEHRFKVWKQIIHRNRRLHLSALKLDRKEQEALTKRYVSLDLYDLARLTRRAKKELLYIADVPEMAQLSLIVFQNLYRYRIQELITEIKYQFLQYESITGLDIITKFTNKWHQIGGDSNGKND